eukprot:9779702-Ditylum_brightwellii.AAC.1
MAALGVLPRCLMTVQPPECTACAIDSMTKRPWQTKASQSKLMRVKALGQYTYVHMQHNLTSEETVQAKKAFKAHTRKHHIE